MNREEQLEKKIETQDLEIEKVKKQMENLEKHIEFLLKNDKNQDKVIETQGERIESHHKLLSDLSEKYIEMKYYLIGLDNSQKELKAFLKEMRDDDKLDKERLFKQNEENMQYIKEKHNESNVFKGKSIYVMVGVGCFFAIAGGFGIGAAMKFAELFI